MSSENNHQQQQDTLEQPLLYETGESKLDCCLLGFS